jgi:hypothetical protein
MGSESRHNAKQPSVTEQGERPIVLVTIGVLAGAIVGWLVASEINFVLCHNIGVGHDFPAELEGAQ